MRQRSRVELFEAIRRDRRTDPTVSVRELASRHGVHRRTVRQALSSAVPPPRKVYPPRARPAIDPWREVIDGWLTGDQDVPRKQRHTARRVWQRLVAEHGAGVAEVTVSRYVAARRVELGVVDREVFVPQDHAPGAEAEVDFGEFETVLAGASVSRDRVESDRFMALRSHYGLIPSSVSPARAAPTRRAASRARSADSADATWFPCPPSPPWLN